MKTSSRSLQDILSKTTIKEIKAQKAKRNFLDFVKYTFPDYKVNWHHELLCNYLNKFAKGEIKKMMVFMPPQHGKSELTSRRLPAYLLGINPNLKIAGCSYNMDLAKSFSRDVQRIIDNKIYNEVFPEATLNSSNVKTSAKGNFLRNALEFEIVGSTGKYKAAGVCSPLTGNSVDIGIVDDPVKDMIEAESPTYRARVWDWYTSVFLTRMHNNSQQLIIQTRWNEDDLSGRILKYMNKNNDWVIVNLPAIKEGFTMTEDPRQIGEPLWPERHSKSKILEIKDADERTFQALYQQDPKPFKGGLVYPSWNLIENEAYSNIKAEPIYGLDWGYTNPCPCIEIKIVGKDMYLKEIFYEKKLKVSDVVNRLRKAKIGGARKIIADSAEPDSIQEVFDSGFNIHPVSKIKNSLAWGIKKVKEYNIHICRSSENIQKEISVYRYRQNKEGDFLEVPIIKDDHALDAIRYVVMSISKRPTKTHIPTNRGNYNNDLPIFF